MLQNDFQTGQHYQNHSIDEYRTDDHNLKQSRGFPSQRKFKILKLSYADNQRQFHANKSTTYKLLSVLHKATNVKMEKEKITDVNY